MLKTLNYNKKNFLKTLEVFLRKRKNIQKKQTSKVTRIIENVKKNGDKSVLNYEKKFSKLKKINKKIFFSNQEINIISKKIDKKLKLAIDLAYNRIKNFT